MRDTYTQAEIGSPLLPPPSVVASPPPSPAAGPGVLLLSYSEEFYSKKRAELGSSFDEARVKYVELLDPELLKSSPDELGTMYDCSSFTVKKTSTIGAESPSQIMLKKGVGVWVLSEKWAIITVIQLEKEDQGQGYGTAIILAITEWLLKQFQVKVIFVRTAGQGGSVKFWNWLNFRRQANSNIYELSLVKGSSVPLSWDIPMLPAVADSPVVDEKCDEEGTTEDPGEEHQQKEEGVEYSTCLTAIPVFPFFSAENLKKDLSVQYPTSIIHATEDQGVMIRFEPVKLTVADTPAKYWPFIVKEADQAFYQVIVSSTTSLLLLV